MIGFFFENDLILWWVLARLMVFYHRAGQMFGRVRGCDLNLLFAGRGTG
jgi:hypothetical protein